LVSEAQDRTADGLFRSVRLAVRFVDYSGKKASGDASDACFVDPTTGPRMEVEAARESMFELDPRGGPKTKDG